jgi:hypothetical protein
MQTTKRTKEIISRFNTLGIFPTDDELNYIANTESYFEGLITPIDVELKLIDVAMSDTNHPYHHMVIPTGQTINL